MIVPFLFLPFMVIAGILALAAIIRTVPVVAEAQKYGDESDEYHRRFWQNHGIVKFNFTRQYEEYPAGNENSTASMLLCLIAFFVYLLLILAAFGAYSHSAGWLAYGLIGMIVASGLVAMDALYWTGNGGWSSLFNKHVIDKDVQHLRKVYYYNNHLKPGQERMPTPAEEAEAKKRNAHVTIPLAQDDDGDGEPDAAAAKRRLIRA